MSKGSGCLGYALSVVPAYAPNKCISTYNSNPPIPPGKAAKNELDQMVAADATELNRMELSLAAAKRIAMKKGAEMQLAVCACKEYCTHAHRHLNKVKKALPSCQPDWTFCTKIQTYRSDMFPLRE